MNEGLELDHFFVALPAGIESIAELAPLFSRLGLEVSFARRHHGQGTENRLLLFRESYLEFLFLVDRDEAAVNELRFDRRFPAIARGEGSPFGLCLRGDLPKDEPFVAYTIPQTTFCVQIWRPSFDDDSLPLIFVAAKDGHAIQGPQRWGEHMEKHFVHACEASGIEAISLPWRKGRQRPKFVESIPGITLHDHDLELRARVDLLGPFGRDATTTTTTIESIMLRSPWPATLERRGE
jgi:hypothetical protein